MKSTSPGSRNTAIIVIILIVAAVVYFYFEGGTTAYTGSLLQGVSSDAGSVGSAELSLLDQLQSLKIDTTLFTTPAYATLQDYSVSIPTQNVGRANPFAPFSGAPVAAPGH